MKSIIPFWRSINLFGVISVVMFLISGCAGFGKRLEPPQMTLANFNVQEVKIFESVFSIEIRAFNTNDIPLEIKGISCDLELNGRRLATGVSNAKVNIPSYETAVIPMTLYSSVLDVITVLRNLTRTEKLEYKLTGHLRLGKGTLPSTIPFKSAGELPVQEFIVPNTT